MLKKNNLDYIIRSMEERDLDDAYQIELTNYDDPWSESVFKSCLDAVGYNFIIIVESMIVGYAMILNAADESQLINIAIHQDYQNRGLGKKFLNDIIHNLEKHIVTMWLEVRTSNTYAQKLYESLSFEAIGIRKDYYPAVSGREDALVYKLEINHTIKQ